MEAADKLGNQTRQFQIATAMGAAAAAVAALMLFGPFKWTVAGLGAAVLAWLLVLTDSRRLLLGLLILAMPLMISKTVIPHDIHMGGSQSLDIIPMDLFLFGLYVHWFFSWLNGRESIRRLPGPLVVSIVGIMVFCILSLTQAVDLSLGLFELWRIIRGILLFLYIYMQLDLDKDLNMVISLLLAGMVIQSLIGLSQYFLNTSFGLTSTGEGGSVLMESIADFEFKRITGSLTAPGALAAYLGLLLPTTLGLLIVKIKPRIKILAVAAGAIAVAALVLTMGRGIWGATAAACVMIVLIATAKRLIPLWLTVASALTAALALISVNYALDNLLWLRLFASDPASYSSRVEMIGAALKAIGQRPLLGLGLNNYTEVIRLFADPRMESAGTYYVPVHSSYLLVAAEIGIPGALFYFSIHFGAIAAAFRGLRSADPTRVALMLGIIGGLSVVLADAAIDWLLHVDIIFFTIWLMAGLAAAVGRDLQMSGTSAAGNY